MELSASRWNSVVRKLVKKRQSLGWNQEELAYRAGYHVNSLRQWETKKVIPSVLAFLAWTDALDVSVSLK